MFKEAFLTGKKEIQAPAPGGFELRPSGHVASAQPLALQPLVKV